MKVVINAVSAKLGGAATYVQNLARSLPEAAEPADRFVFVVPPGCALESAAPHVRVQCSDAATGSYARRWWWDQVELRRIVSREQPDVLFSSANFAMLNCPCPQALLVRNPIYFSQEYLAHVLPGAGIALRAETAVRRWLVAQSVAAADCVMTPSAAMLDDLRRFVTLPEQRTAVNPYGVPACRVLSAARNSQEGGPVRFLWVSHYADHKNLGTLLRAAQTLQSQGLSFELLLTLDAARHSGQHTAMTAVERGLLHALGEVVRCVGVQSYEDTWKLYSSADVFVFPSLTESFGHPLVEAMASQLPIIASDTAIHREICGNAAEYFAVLDAAALAGQMRRLAESQGERRRLAALGQIRVKSFIWEDHVRRLLDLLRATAQLRRARAA
jgi:glycosyltransferase involved in cell wall biosynthesis